MHIFCPRSVETRLPHSAVLQTVCHHQISHTFVLTHCTIAYTYIMTYNNVCHELLVIRTSIPLWVFDLLRHPPPPPPPDSPPSIIVTAARFFFLNIIYSTYGYTIIISHNLRYLLVRYTGCRAATDDQKTLDVVPKRRKRTFVLLFERNYGKRVIQTNLFFFQSTRFTQYIEEPFNLLSLVHPATYTCTQYVHFTHTCSTTVHSQSIIFVQELKGILRTNEAGFSGDRHLTRSISNRQTRNGCPNSEKSNKEFVCNTFRINTYQDRPGQDLNSIGRVES